MILELESVTKRFGGLVALDTVSFGVEKGKITAVIGPNGAGKTTLFNVISGVFAPDEGEVRFRDQPLTGLPPHKVAAQGLIRTFQLVKLFQNMSVSENVQVGCHLRTQGGPISAILRPPRIRQIETSVRDKAEALLEMVGLDSMGSLPATALSYGQQRLLEIARALAAEPDMVLLDEPAAGLNHDESEQLGEVIRRIASGGTTVLMIEHDMNLVMNIAHKVVVLDFGKFLAEGNPAQVQKNPAVLAAYLGEPEPSHA